jgi:hypothetical protein
MNPLLLLLLAIILWLALYGAAALAVSSLERSGQMGCRAYRVFQHVICMCAEPVHAAARVLFHGRGIVRELRNK